MLYFSLPVIRSLVLAIYMDAVVIDSHSEIVMHGRKLRLGTYRKNEERKRQMKKANKLGI